MPNPENRKGMAKWEAPPSNPEIPKPNPETNAPEQAPSRPAPAKAVPGAQARDAAPIPESQPPTAEQLLTGKTVEELVEMLQKLVNGSDPSSVESIARELMEKRMKNGQ